MDLGNVRCIKSEDLRLLVMDEEIKERWRSYFHKLFNENHIWEWEHNIESNISLSRNCRHIRKIRLSGAKDALKKMETGRAEGSDGIPIEVWKHLRDAGFSIVN